MSTDKFFFEEDPEASEGTGLTPEEHTDCFLTALEANGIIKDRGFLPSLDPFQVQAETAKTQHKTTGLIDIEYGIAKSDYVLHITPLHHQKNLTNKNLLDAAVKTAVMELNKIVPPTMHVDIFLPRHDYEIKATSFVIKDGGDAWNLDRDKIETEVVPQLVELIGKICMRA